MMLAADLRISEFQAINDSTIDDDDGKASDWIEIHNAGSSAIDLDDWYLTDNALRPRKWAFPSMDLAAGDYLLVFASEENRKDPTRPLHTNFKLTSSGEYLALVHDEPDEQNPGQFIATVVQDFGEQYPQQIVDVSYGLASTGDIQREVLVPQFAPATAIVPVDTSLDGPDDDNRAWTQVGFNDAGWLSGNTGVGFDSRNDAINYDALIGIDVQSQMLNLRKGVYTRIEFEVADPTVLETLVLRMKYDDAFVAYINGLRVASSANAPTGVPAFNSAPTSDHPDSAAIVFEDFNITQHVDKLLANQTNVLAIQGINHRNGDNDLLILPELVATSSDPDAPIEATYFLTPTPGEPNSLGATTFGPIVSDTGHTPHVPAANEDLVVTARVTQAFAPISSVTLRYRVMYGSQRTLTMVDDGSGADELAGDGTFTAVIPSSRYSAGQMVRWKIETRDTESNTFRFPLFRSTTDSDEYLGTVVEDPSLESSNVPVMQWFTNNPNGANFDSGSRGSLFYEGEFYDNIMVDIHGQSTRGFPKKSYDFDFNKGHRFKWAKGERRVKDINLLTNWADRSKTRNTLAYETFANADAPYHFAFPVRVQQNGQFFSIADMVEDGDNRFTERIGFDGDGALYKMYNTFTNINGAQKKSRKEEGNADLQALLNGVSLSGTARTRFVYDNIDVAQSINVMASYILVSNADCCHKNYYFYRDLPPDEGGAGEWHILPWDQDLVFGHNWRGGPAYFDDVIYPRNGLFVGNNNRFVQSLLNVEPSRSMYLRRIRTLMDELLQPPGTPQEELKFEARLDELVAQLDPNDDPVGQGTDDADLDYRKWDQPRFSPWNNGGKRTMRNEVDRIKNQFLAPRRNYLYGLSTLPRAQPDFASLPASQRKITFGTIEFSPASGIQDEEYIEIRNDNNIAVDISGWKLGGGVKLEFQGGTVIPRNSTLYVSPDLATFRARSSGPRGGQSLLVAGGYKGHLSAFGETLVLFDKSGEEIVSTSYEGAPSQQQQFLRITEINYNPADPTPAELAIDARFDNDDFEFVELRNIGTQSFNLAGVHFNEGISYAFGNHSLEPGERIIVARDLDAFAARYGNDLAADVVGPFTSGALSNGGENLKLEDVDNGTILEFKFDDDWYTNTDGDGFSLVVRDAGVETSRWGKKNTWRASEFTGGTPGDVDSGLNPGAIEINELLTHTDAPGGDWIELRNTTQQTIDLGGWFFSDDAADLKKYRIADNTRLGPGEFVVYLQSDHFGIGAADPGALTGFGLNELGETLYLTSATTAGELKGLREIQTFGPADREVTFGRHVKSDGGDDFVAMDEPTPGETNSLPRVGPLVIHEIMYNPAQSGFEYLELKNITDAPLPLFDPLHIENTWRFTDGISFTFPADVTVDPQALVLVVSTDPDTFRQAHNVPAETLIFGPFFGALANDGEKVVLSKPGDPQPDENMTVPMIEAERVTYKDKLPWPTEADGEGASLQRLDATAYGSDPINWAADTGGGTPGDVPPQVVEVLVWGSSWSPAFFDALTRAGLGSGGVSIPTGSSQLDVLPWSSIDQIRIRFNRNVNVVRGDLAVRGVAQAVHSIDDFAYNPTTMTATWTLAADVPAEKLLIDLSGSVADTRGNTLDGDWINTQSTFPSGNGVVQSDENFQFRLNVLPGDSDLDGDVDRLDLLNIVRRLSADVDSTAYEPRLDVNADGRIDVDDLRQVLLRTTTRLPAGEPTSAGDSAPAVAVDAMFARLGFGGPAAVATSVDALGTLRTSAAETLFHRLGERESTSIASRSDLASRRAAGRAATPGRHRAAIVDLALPDEAVESASLRRSTERPAAARRRR